MFSSPYIKLQYLTCVRMMLYIVSYKFKLALIWNKNVMNDAQQRISILLPCTAW